jgi:hypothetical protein
MFKNFVLISLLCMQTFAFIAAQFCPPIGCPNPSVSLKPATDSYCTASQNAANQRVFYYAVEAILREHSERYSLTSAYSSTFLSVFGKCTNVAKLEVTSCLGKLSTWARGHRKRQHYSRCSNTDVRYAGYRVENYVPVIITNSAFTNDAARIPAPGSGVNVFKNTFSIAEPIRTMVHELVHSLCGLTDPVYDNIRYSDYETWVQYRDSFNGKQTVGRVADAYAVYITAIAHLSVNKQKLI